MQIIPSFLVDKGFFLPLRLSCKERLFSKTYPSFLTLKEGSTSHLGLLSSGEKKETALLGAQNRYALRLAGHQSPRHGCAGWDRLTVMEISAYVLYQIIQNANLNELILLHYCSYQTKSKVYHFLYGIPYSSSSCLSKNEDYILPVSDCLLPKA